MSNLLTNVIDNGYLKKLQLLIKYGANINLPTSYGYTPLMYAAFNNKPEAVTILLQAGASTEGVIKKGHFKGGTFHRYAQQNPQVQLVYDQYKKEVTAQATEQLSGIKDLGNIVGEYLFTPESEAAIEQKLIDAEEKQAATHLSDFGLPLPGPHFQTGAPERERFFRPEQEEQQPTPWERFKGFWTTKKK